MTATITSFVAVFFVIPPLTNLLPTSSTDHFVQHLPSNAGAVLLDGTFGVAHPLTPWTGFAVMSGCAVVLIGFAVWRLRRVDACLSRLLLHGDQQQDRRVSRC